MDKTKTFPALSLPVIHTKKRSGLCRRRCSERLLVNFSAPAVNRSPLCFLNLCFEKHLVSCVLQQFCGVLGHTFMEFLKGSGDYCQAQHAAYADEWTAKLAIDPTHLSHRRDPENWQDRDTSQNQRQLGLDGVTPPAAHCPRRLPPGLNRGGTSLVF